MLLRIPMHSTSSMNKVLALTAISSSSSSWFRTRPLRELLASRRRAWSWATLSVISLTSSIRRYWTASLHSSTLGLFWRVSSRVCATFMGFSLASMAISSVAMFSSCSLIWLIICWRINNTCLFL